MGATKKSLRKTGGNFRVAEKNFGGQMWTYSGSKELFYFFIALLNANVNFYRRGRYLIENIEVLDLILTPGLGACLSLKKLTFNNKQVREVIIDI